eukprot:COSAG01_NODE_14152_length_1490_cov_59.855500_2_plen_48_part_00
MSWPYMYIRVKIILVDFVEALYGLKGLKFCRNRMKYEQESVFTKVPL